MQIVIDVPEEKYNTIMNYSKEWDEWALNAIKNGKPVPRGHGDLIDRRELKKEVYTTTEWNGDVHRIIYEASVDNAPTIIEADTESEVEK